MKSKLKDLEKKMLAKMISRIDQDDLALDELHRLTPAQKLVRKHKIRAMIRERITQEVTR